MEYTRSAEMIADGLTKALPAGKWPAFLRQLGLEDVQARQRDKEAEGKAQEAKADEIEDLLYD